MYFPLGSSPNGGGAEIIERIEIFQFRILAVLKITIAIARLHGERIYNYIHCKNEVCIPYQMV